MVFSRVLEGVSTGEACPGPVVVGLEHLLERLLEDVHGEGVSEHHRAAGAIHAHLQAGLPEAASRTECRVTFCVLDSRALRCAGDINMGNAFFVFQARPYLLLSSPEKGAAM